MEQDISASSIALRQPHILRRILTYLRPEWRLLRKLSLVNNQWHAEAIPLLWHGSSIVDFDDIGAEKDTPSIRGLLEITRSSPEHFREYVRHTKILWFTKDNSELGIFDNPSEKPKVESRNDLFVRDLWSTCHPRVIEETDGPALHLEEFEVIPLAHLQYMTTSGMKQVGPLLQHLKPMRYLNTLEVETLSWDGWDEPDTAQRSLAREYGELPLGQYKEELDKDASFKMKLDEEVIPILRTRLPALCDLGSDYARRPWTTICNALMPENQPKPSGHIDEWHDSVWISEARHAVFDSV